MIYLPKIENNSVVKIFSFLLKMWVVFERWYFSIILFLLFCFKDEALVDWVNPMYLDTGVVKDIRARFKDESEIQLQEFLLVNLYLISTFVTFSLLTDWECQRVKYLVQFCELWVKLSSQPDLIQKICTNQKTITPILSFLIAHNILWGHMLGCAALCNLSHVGPRRNFTKSCLFPFFLRAGGRIGQMRPTFSPCICNSL